MKAPSILVVEDNPVTRKAVCSMLASRGYTVLEAASGGCAIELMVETPPDLILQDLMLSDMDGCTLMRLLRRLPGGRDARIMAFSAFPAKLAEASGLQAGFDDCLSKPLTPERLLDAIEANLARKRTSSH